MSFPVDFAKIYYRKPSDDYFWLYHFRWNWGFGPRCSDIEKPKPFKKRSAYIKSHKNQSVKLQSKSIHWILFDGYLVSNLTLNELYINLRYHNWLRCMCCFIYLFILKNTFYYFCLHGFAHSLPNFKTEEYFLKKISHYILHITQNLIVDWQEKNSCFHKNNS